MARNAQDSFHQALQEQLPFSAPTVERVRDEVYRSAETAREHGLFAAARTIGFSRENRPLFGLRLGGGALRISITAGAHADEPAGPLAALALAHWLATTPAGRNLLNLTSWHICPHVNPDGAERNARWFADPPDLRTYMEGVVRETPGDDVEFNYPMGNSAPDAAKPPRPENQAVAAFLGEGGPYHLHASLHGMALAEGAWWLIGREWVDRTDPLRRELEALFQQLDLGVHDIDRKGKKGFHRIERGFATTPTGTAMREFFTGRGQDEMARLFLASSMEYIQSLGGDPLVMVSEIPLFRIYGGGPLPDPPPDDTPFTRVRARLPEARLALAEGKPEIFEDLVTEFDIRPVPFLRQAEGVALGFLAAVRWLETPDIEDSPLT